MIHNGQSGKTSLGDLSELERGFYHIDLKLTNYLDTTYYLLINRSVTDTISVELREQYDIPQTPPDSGGITDRQLTAESEPGGFTDW